MESMNMRNEDAVQYDASAVQAAPSIISDEKMLSSAKIKLVGHEEPTKRICNAYELEAYCINLLSDCAVEEFHVICVNAQCQIICETTISTGSLSEVSAYPRVIATVALLSNAHSVFLTHNHPGGTCSPSREDIVSTNNIIKSLKLFSIRVLDHMIITPGGAAYSMTRNRDIDLYD